MMPSLLPPGSSALTKAITQANAAMFNIDMPHQVVLSPDRCPVAWLPWLAREYSVDVYQDSWSESQKRAAIKAAPNIHRYKGTASAVKSALKLVHPDLSLTEWWQTTPKGEPHTFRVDYPADLGNSATFQHQICNALDSSKPLRSHYQIRPTITSAFMADVTCRLRAATLYHLEFSE